MAPAKSQERIDKMVAAFQGSPEGTVLTVVELSDLTGIPKSQIYTTLYTDRGKRLARDGGGFKLASPPAAPPGVAYRTVVVREEIAVVAEHWARLTKQTLGEIIEQNVVLGAGMCEDMVKEEDGCLEDILAAERVIGLSIPVAVARDPDAEYKRLKGALRILPDGTIAVDHGLDLFEVLTALGRVAHFARRAAAWKALAKRLRAATQKPALPPVPELPPAQADCPILPTSEPVLPEVSDRPPEPEPEPEPPAPATPQHGVCWRLATEDRCRRLTPILATGRAAQVCVLHATAGARSYWKGLEEKHGRPTIYPPEDATAEDAPIPTSMTAPFHGRPPKRERVVAVGDGDPIAEADAASPDDDASEGDSANPGRTPQIRGGLHESGVDSANPAESEPSEDLEEEPEPTAPAPKFDPVEPVEEEPGDEVPEPDDADPEPEVVEVAEEAAEEAPRREHAPRKRRGRRVLTEEQLAKLKRCPCCSRVVTGGKVNCTDCMFCVDEGDGKWRSRGMCPKIHVRTIKKVSAAQYEKEREAAKGKKPTVEQDRRVKPFRPKYTPF